MASFFKYLWRVNAVLAFLLLAAAIGFLALLSKDRLERTWRTSFAPPASAAKDAPPLRYSYELEKGLLIGADTAREDFELYRLNRWGKIQDRVVTPEGSACVNLLVVDKKTGANHWLFAGFARAIIGQEAILGGRWMWHEPEVDDDVPVEIVVLKVIEADSNSDGVLTADDRQTLYVARLPAVAPEKLLAADAVWFTMQKGKEYQIGYRDHGEGYLATYALPDFTLTSKTKVEGLPN